MKYPREKYLEPRNSHQKKFWIHKIPKKGRWHDDTRPKMARDPLKLAYSYNSHLLHNLNDP